MNSWRRVTLLLWSLPPELAQSIPSPDGSPSSSRMWLLSKCSLLSVDTDAHVGASLQYVYLGCCVYENKGNIHNSDLWRSFWRLRRSFPCSLPPPHPAFSWLLCSVSPPFSPTFFSTPRSFLSVFSLSTSLLPLWSQSFNSMSFFKKQSTCVFQICPYEGDYLDQSEKGLVKMIP